MLEGRIADGQTVTVTANDKGLVVNGAAVAAEAAE